MVKIFDGQLGVSEALGSEIGLSTQAVVKVHAEQHGDVVDVLTVIDRLDRSTVALVCDAQAHFARQHREFHFRFDMLEVGERSESLESPIAYVR